MADDLGGASVYRGRVLPRIARLATRRPRLVLAVWLLAVALLGIEGVGVPDRLNTGALYLDGVESTEAYELKKRHFGDEEVQAVMLRGPERELERQGPRIARALDAVEGTQVISPWSGGEGVEALRPKRGVAAIVVNKSRKPGQGLPDVVPPVEDALEASVRPPLEASVTGQAQVGVGGRDAAEEAARQSEIVTAPVVIVVLLLVFGSPIAAMIPGLVGAATVAAGYGLISLLLPVIDIDALGPTLVAMMGLALGVDYSLLIVSRFRDELRRGHDRAEAAALTVVTSGRAVVFAGVALILAMLLATQIAPGRIVVTAAVAVIIASVVSVIAALFVVPALLVVAGGHLERWRLYKRREDRSAAASVAGVALRRPIPVATLTAIALLALTSQAFEMNTGPISAGVLPEGNSARESYYTVQEGLGPGWGSAFEVIVDGRGRPITEPYRLRMLARFQRRLERDPGVLTVAGPAAIYQRTRPLRAIEDALEAAARAAAQARRAGAAAGAQPGAAQPGAPAAGAPPGGQDPAAALRQLRRASPGLFESGYFYLAGIDGARGPVRERAGLVVNVDNGGDAARYVIVPRHGPQDPRILETKDRLEQYADQLARRIQADVLVGGQAAIVNDYNRVARDRLPLLVALLALVTVPVLLLVLRSLLLPLVAALLNLLIVGATFGLLALLFNDALLGGPGYVDATAAGSIITVIYGLSIDYEVFVLARMREEYVRTGDARLAIEQGLGKTARIVTGAGVIMIGVFLAFSTADLISVRHFGVGLAIAVFLDAFVIRLLALPALMRLLGEWSWWLPGWLDRVLPRFDVEPPEDGDPPPAAMAPPPAPQPVEV